MIWGNRRFRRGHTHQRTADPANLGPIEGQHAHTQARINTKDLVNRDIVWCSPTYKREHRKCLEQETLDVVCQNSELVGYGKGIRLPGKKKKKKLPVATIMKNR